MSTSTTLHVVTVFLGDGGTGGNELGVFLEAPGLPQDSRQRIAADLGFAETVFVEDPAAGRVHIHTPAVELPLAGHPLVGTAWLLAREGAPVAALEPPAGAVPTWSDGERVWIRADPGLAPVFDTRQLASPAAVDALTGGEEGVDLHVWAWQDEEAGSVRVRVFPDAMGIAEDEATGAAALRLGGLLGRPLTVHQGTGSRIDVRPGAGGTVEIGGRVALLATREYRLS
ncbi:PhzF family phenazine biosynthesis protein [Streptomonospora litoralis]|uniref:Trans-2,3-dihydro-3-hydroxyanthranilate isomerase n=1 Tax=Streptomonospora litoralis TaxID=2498135 RepID=A0A4P6Q7R0_9ACTN|nr:PhzF family phenazine biosynthesis protein [Streptomonospora litoralis]QBI55169.1 Trans-2,3-dihydro-3-hydroxyanthranilate isomerase [Streptomonospora litoralis]